MNRTVHKIEIYRGRLLTLITGSSSRLLRIRFSADLIMYWFPVYHFRCMKFKSLVIWMLGDTTVGKSSLLRCLTGQEFQGKIRRTIGLYALLLSNMGTKVIADMSVLSLLWQWLLW
jgi:hypothetical protein